MALSRKNKLLKIYLFVTIYSNALRIVFGKWATILADIILLLILAYVLFAQNFGKIRFNKSLRYIMGAIVLLQILSIVGISNGNITNKLYGLVEYRKSVFQIMCFFLAYYCSDNEKFWNNLEFTEWLVVPTILYGIKQTLFYSRFDSIFYRLQDAGADTLQYRGVRRAISIYSGPFHFGMMCSIILCVAIALLIKTNKKRNILVIILCLFGSYCSLTRTNIVCSFIVLSIYGMHILTEDTTVQSLLRKLIMLATVLIIAGWFVVEYSSLLDNKNSVALLINSILNMGDDNRFIGRIDTWTIALEMIKQRPIWGYGMGAAGDTLVSYGVAIKSVTPHNIFIKLQIETGILGLILLIIILINAWYICIKKSYGLERSFFWSCFAVVILNGLVGSTISTFPIMSLFWIFIGMQASKKNLSNTEVRCEKNSSYY